MRNKSDGGSEDEIFVLLQCIDNQTKTTEEIHPGWLISFIRLGRETLQNSLTWIRLIGPDLLVNLDDTDGDCLGEIDQEGQKRMNEEKEKMKCHRQRPIACRNLQDTESFMTL